VVGLDFVVIDLDLTVVGFGIDLDLKTVHFHSALGY